MPLNKSASVSENISELHTGKTYSHTAEKFGKDKANKQAVAIALNVAREARRQKRAMGGFTNPMAAFDEKGAARGLMHTGAINSSVAGRTDHLPMSVKAGSYVLPADHVSSLGQGNTAAGHAVINSMFGAGGPYGAGSMKIAHGSGAPHGKMKLASGGSSDEGGARGESTGSPVEIVAAGGEHVLEPSQVAAVGGGDITHGHKILDAWVKSNREKHIKTLKKLPAPAKK